MEFDVNLVLVPATLVFLLTYLADKFWLKQHKVVKQNAKQVVLAQNQLDVCHKELQASLKMYYGNDDVERFTITDSTPSDVLSLYETYQSAKRKLAENKSTLTATKEFFLVNWAYEWLPILLTLVLVQSFVVRQFNIPSSSMVPTLYTGDFILVNPSAYGFRLPLINTKILNTGTPQNGDVAVFRYPSNEKLYYIKRVIGVPGDTVRYDHGVLFVNGKEIATTKTDYQMNEELVAHLYPNKINDQKLSPEQQKELGMVEEKHASYQREILGEHNYAVRYLEGAMTNQMADFLKDQATSLGQGGQVWEIKVPDDVYFVMGDNRDRSEDSRFWGFVHDRHLAGKANYIWMHKEPGLKLPSFERTGKID